MECSVGFISLGCPKNLVNSEQMMYLLQAAGCDVTGETVDVDVVVVNACGFIESAQQEAIDTILELGELKSEGRIGKIVVCGCLPQRFGDEVMEQMPEVDALVGVGSFGDIVSVVEGVLNDETPKAFGDINAPDLESKRVFTTSGVWEYIKIAEGCDNRCAYCAIPDIRGRFRSRPMENIIAEAQEFAERGVRELIVVAQDITRYGRDLYGKRKLSDLLRELVKIRGIDWIRLHYLYPDEIDDELIDVIAENDKILKYLDIPMQHINTPILRTMCRRGTGDEIRALVKKLRERIPGVVIRTSLIAGLPGEGEAEFEELCEFLREAKIERAGVFPFSPEEGTKAAEMEYPPHEVAERRAALVADIQAQIMDEFTASRIGTTVAVLVEGYDGEYFLGRSYAESPDIDGVIYIEGENLVLNGFVNVEITGVIDGEPVGVVVEGA